MQRLKKSVDDKRPERAPLPLRLFAWLFLGIVLVSLLCVLMMHIPAAQEWVLKEALRKLEASTGIAVELDSFRWSPFRELHLFGMNVKAAGENVLECDEAKLGYRFSWIWPYIHPAELSLEKPQLQLERDPEGNFQLFPGKPGDSGDSRERKTIPWAGLPWPQVRITSGAITAYQNGQVVLSVRDVNATLLLEHIPGSDGPKLKINFGQWQGCVDVPDLGEWKLTGEAEIRGQTLSVSALEFSAPGFAEVSSQGRWELSPPFDGTLQIQVMSLSPTLLPQFQEKFHALKDVSGSLHLTRRSGNWTLDHDLKSNLGNLQGTLLVEPHSAGGRYVQLLSHFAGLHLTGPSKPSESQLFGRIAFTLEGSRLETAQARLRVLLESSRWGGHEIHGGELKGSYEGGIAEVKASKIQSSLGDFDFSGYADLRGLWDRHHQGRIRFDLRAERAGLGKMVSGTTQRFGGSIVGEAQYGPDDFTRWERWQGKMEANLSLPEVLTLKASGLQKNESLTLDYDLAVMDLQKLSGLIPQWQGRGKAASRGSIRGRWPDLVWEGSLSSPAFQVGPVQGEQASLKGKGQIIGKGGRRELTVKVQNLTAQGNKLGAWNLDLEQEADTCRFNVRGEGALNHGGTKLSGRVENIWGPVRTLLVNQSVLSWKNQTAQLDARIEAGIDGIRVHSLALQQNKQKLQAVGEVWFDARTDLKITLDGIDLSQWSHLFSPAHQVFGTVSGQVYVKGRSDQPEATLSLLVTQGILAAPRTQDRAQDSSRQLKGASQGPVIERLQLQGSFARDSMNVQGDLQSPALQNPVHLSARIPMHLSFKPPRFEISLAEPWAFSFRVSGLQAVSILPYITVLQALGGRVDLDAEGSGTFNQPLVAATGSWRNGSMKIKQLPYPVDNIDVDWQADARQIIVVRSVMEILGGHLQIKGRVGYPSFQEMTFDAESTDLEVKDLYGIKGKVAGHAQLTATAASGKLTADLNLAGAEMDLSQFETGLARNIRVIDADTKGDIVEVRKESTDRDTFYNRLEMDLTINLPPSGTWVRGMGLDAEITGTLKIEKRPFAPLKLRGGFQTLRGEYRFQDYKLKIIDGELIFPESPQPDPQLKIVCQKDVKDAIIQVQVTGPLKQPKLIMSSMPSMNQVDILSYLLFDRPATDLSSKESFQLQDKAASWLGSQTSQLLKRVLGDTPFTPDTIEYRKGLSKTTGGANTRTEVGIVSIGKYVTPDLYVNFEKSVTGEEGNQVDVEYRLNRYLSIQTQFGGTNQSGIDVFWRYDFGN